MNKQALTILNAYLVGVCILLRIIGTGAPLHAQTADTPEYYFKAAFLANFARLVEWPAEAFEHDNQPLVLCIQDPLPFGDALKAIDGKQVKGRRLAVRICGQGCKPGTCHILFANAPDPRARRMAMAAVKGKPVLVVGETQGFATRGGMINFYTVKNKIRFEINQSQSGRAGLKISSRLFKLGRIVQTSADR